MPQIYHDTSWYIMIDPISKSQVPFLTRMPLGVQSIQVGLQQRRLRGQRLNSQDDRCQRGPIPQLRANFHQDAEAFHPVFEETSWDRPRISLGHPWPTETVPNLRKKRLKRQFLESAKGQLKDQHPILRRGLQKVKGKWAGIMISRYYRSYE